MEEDLLGLTDFSDNVQELTRENKTYYDIEQELIETKRRLDMLESKMNLLLERSATNVKRRLDMLESNMNLLLEGSATNVKRRLDILESNMNLLLERNTTNLICIPSNYNSKINIHRSQFIDINCKSIKFDYCPGFRQENLKESDHGFGIHSGFMLYFDDAKISSMNYDKNFIFTLINQLKNISSLEILFRFPISDNKMSTDPWLYNDSWLHYPKEESYYKLHFNIFKQIIQNGNNLIINIEIHSNMPLEWFVYLFEDINRKNIQSINISCNGAADIYIQNGRLKEVLKKIDSKLLKKIKANY